MRVAGRKGLKEEPMKENHFEKATGSLLALAPDVACLQLALVNVYFVGMPGIGARKWVLVDTGMPTSRHAILRAAEQRFGVDVPPAAIVLTHGHFDHAGSVRELASHWDVPVYAHPLEMPYLTGLSDYPPPDPTVGGGLLATVASRFFPRSGIDLSWRAHPLPEDGQVMNMSGWRWIHTPGHTPGHISLFRDDDRLLIAGDAFVTQRQESFLAVVTHRQEVSRPPAYFTPDWTAARRSVQALASLEPSIAATGHGVPMSGVEMREELHALADQFDLLAVPAHGRYVDQPAHADESGVVSVPPPVRDPLPWLLAAAGAIAVGTALLRGRARARA
jgi:glyoxylase-like metal-dependent hydrolase (beta-lactamase superfamily II)